MLVIMDLDSGKILLNSLRSFFASASGTGYTMDVADVLLCAEADGAAAAAAAAAEDSFHVLRRLAT